jgi:hypothetical protein
MAPRISNDDGQDYTNTPFFLKLAANAVQTTINLSVRYFAAIDQQFSVAQEQDKAPCK